MELAQVWVAQTPPRLEILQRRLIDPVCLFQPDAMGRVQLLLQKFDSLPARRDEQVSVDAIKIAVDLLLARDRLDLVDRRAVAFGGELEPLEPVQLLDFRQ